MTLTYPELVVLNDYDGYFQNLVKSWLDRRTTPFQNKKIFISAGPYRASAVTVIPKKDGLHLDFYSAIRTGFGSLPEEDIEEIIENWL